MKSLGTRRGERDTYLLPSSPSSKSDKERANEIITPKITLSAKQAEALGITKADVGDKYEAKIQFEVTGVEKGDTSSYGDYSPSKSNKTSITIALTGCDTASESATTVEEPEKLDIKEKTGKPKPERAGANEAKSLED